MKRFAAFLLTLLLVFTLCSCGKKHVEEQTVPPAVEDQTGEQQPEVKPAPQPVKPDDTAEDETVVTVPVTPVVKPAEEVKPQGGTSGGGHHVGGGTTVNDLTITEGKNVSGGTYKDVIIAESVGDGTVTLENVTIDGQLIIRGGGSNSVKVKNSKVKEVKLDKDTSTGGEAPRLELTGTEVKTVEVAKPAIIEAKDTASKVETLSAKDDVTIKGEETKVQNVTVPTEAKENVKLTVNDAAVEKVEVNKPVTIETKAAEGKTPVTAVEAKANVTVTGAATNVGTVTVPEAAESKNVKLQVNNAKVAQVKAEAPVTIETNSAMGETPVAAVEAKANVTVTGAATNVGKVTVPEETKNAVKLTVTDAKVAEVSAEKPMTIEANENASKIEKVEALDTVTVQGDTKIDQVEAKAPVTVDGAKTKIETITVPAGVTTAPEIKVTAGSVNTVKADGKSKVSGTAANAIANVEAAAPVEVNSAAVAKVTVTVNVTVTVSGNGQIEVAVDTNANVEIQAENTENLSVSTSQTVATNITVKTGEETKEVHVHKWVESGREEADCTTNGYIDYKCTTCSEEKTETIPAKGHVEVVIPAVEPTCTLPGSTAGKKCAVCEASIVTPRTIDALGHDFNGSLVSDETGHWHVCAYCGAVDTKQTHTYPTTSCTAAAKCTGCGYQKAAGVHTWDAGKVQKTATCETAGSMLYTCTSCGDTKTETIPTLGHVYGAPKYVWKDTSCTATRACTRDGCSHKETETVTGTKTVLKLPTCEETGIESYSVTFKNAAFAPQTNQVTSKAIGHKLSKVEAKSATCAEVGNNAYWVCSECGKVFSDAEGKTATTVAAQMINLLSHTKVHTTAKAATCTEDGTKEYWTCSVCKKVFADEKCTIETTVAARALKALGHTFDQEVADSKYLKSAATCTEKAVYYKSCSCGEKGTETFTSGEVLGHLYGEPTWTWTGYTSAKATFACTRSGCTHTEEVTATGAAITNAVTTSAGCDSTGTRTYTATVTFGGKGYTDTKTETLAVLGHTGSKVTGQAATCEMDGWKDYYECSVCNKHFSDADCENEIPDLYGWKTAGGKIKATGHNYDTEPVWSWAENHTTATATFTCTRDSSHTVSVTASGTDITHEDVTHYNAEGTRTYTATVVFDGKTYQNTATKTIPATPFKVGENTYATYAEALAAAHQVGLQATQFADIQYQVYPTIEIYGSCTMTDLNVATHESITVESGGSLTVGSLTLDESTMNGWWLDAGTLRLEKGSSFRLGMVQYTGTNGAFVMGDASSNIELAGRAPDMEGNDYVAVFNGNITQQNTFAMDSSYMFFNEQNSVLTVKGTLTNNAYMDNRGAILIDGGTLINKNTIDNESGIIPNVAGSINIKSGALTNEAKAKITGGGIDAFGSTVNNAGTIRIGDGCALVIENGSTLDNTGTLAGGQGSEINIGDYIYTDETEKVTNTVTGIDNNEAVTVPVMKAAAVFDVSKLQDALDTYDYVVPCGTETTGTNTVTLGNLTVPKGKLLILKETVNNGTNQYHNKFVLGKIEIQRDPAEKDPHNGNLVTVGNPDVTVNGRINAYGFIAFDTLTIADKGYVYVENEMMIVDKALTIATGGTLEIGSGSQMYYRGENNAVINGTLIKTVRNMNGFVNQVCSDIQGKGMTPKATLTTLVITEDTILHGQHTVDTVIPIQYKDDDDHIVAPTLRVGANSSLKFKELYTDEGGTKAQIIGLSEGTDENGYYTVLPAEGSVVTVTTSSDFLAALDDPEVTDITITEDITLTYADNLWNHPITKAVTVDKTATLEIKPYTPSEDGPAEPGMKFNGLVIAANGSLTLDKGWLGGNKAILKTGTITSGEENEMWYEYRSQVNVNGGVLDAKDGVLATGSTGNIDFEVGNGQLLLPNNVNDYLITYTVDSKEELLSANKEDNPCNNILLKSDVVLTEDYTVNKALSVMNDEWRMYRLTVSSGKTLTVPENVTLYVNGELRVEGTLDNNGTIVGEGFIDVMGGTLENSGAIDLAGDIGVEKGGTLRNSGTVSENTSFTLADYRYADGSQDAYMLAEGTTLETLGDKVTVMAVAFSPEQVQSALREDKYGMVMACGEDDESTVVLDGIIVPDGKTLMLKDYVDVGERTIHNTYDLSNITFGENAYLLIKGDPAIHINGELDYGHVIWKGNPDIYALGFVHDKEGLKAALQNGGDIYLYPFAMKDRHKEEFTFEDGHTEEVYETQYWIDTTAIATDTNLIKMGGEDPMAVFFKNGFTVTSDTTLRFDGLNVVAAADSTVNGRVEAYNGALVVQGENDGATLINNGTIQIGSKEVWGQFAIFDESKPNKIVNYGTIESFGELKFDRNQNRNPLQFTGNDPIEYATFRDLVCELQQNFGNLPNLEQIDFENKDSYGVVDFAPVYAYPDGGNEFFHADDPDHSDFDAIEAFSWLIKNEIVPQHSNQNPKLNPWHYMTYNEVGDLFNKFATKVLGTATDLDIATGTDLADKNFCFGKLHDALGDLSRAEVSDEQQLQAALNAPYVTEIHIKGDIVLGTRTDLQPAGEYHDQHREIFVEPNIILTVPQNIQMDIKQNVKLVVVCDNKTNTRGQLIVNGNVNVFGELEPDENDQSRITVEEGGYISYFGNAYFFGERLLKVARDYMSQKNVIPEGYNQIDGWDNNEQVTCLVAYGLKPQEDDNGHKWWDFGRTLSYGEMKTVLTNVYRDVYRDALATSSDLPGNVSVGDDQWPKENDILDNRNVEELLGKFALVLPKLDDTTTNSFVIQRTNGEDNTDGKTIIGKTFTNAITVTAVKTNDNFAGELNFVNCTFNGGITLNYNPYCDYRVNFNDSCTGAVTTDYPEGITGGDPRIRIAHPNGMTITANALTAFEMNDGCLCSTDSFTVNGLTINGNGCGNLEVDVRKDDTIPTIDVTGSENGNAIELSGSYTGKLRVSGCMDVSGVTLRENSWIELANWYDEKNHCGAPDSTINLGTNDISINDDNGSHCFTGTGTIHVNNGPKENLHLTVNDRNLANPHVFGKVPDCAVFLGLRDVNNVSFSLKQGTWDEENKRVSSWTDIPQESFAAVYYNENGKVTEENPDPTKTHLERVDGVSGWITDPHHVNLTVQVTDGCTVVYDKLWYKDA